MMIYKYLVIAVLLIVCELVYFKIASDGNIIDKPNARSSHNKAVPRGGGIIFLMGVWIWSAFFGFAYPCLLAAVTLAAGVSFVDDIRSLPNWVRLLVQFVAMGTMFYQLDMLHLQMWWIILIALFVCVGATNIYNFMDGINGITAGYTLAVLVPLFFINRMGTFVEESLIVVGIIATLVFAFFNFRPKNKAKCFAGDVGAVGIAFILLFIIGRLILKSKDVTWLVFLAVYGVDGCLTICHRIMLHENLGKAHRKHMYQIMSNELGMGHMTVSLIYMSVQLLISLAMVYLVPQTVAAHWIYFAAVIGVLSLTYLLFMKKYYHLHEEYLASLRMPACESLLLFTRLGLGTEEFGGLKAPIPWKPMIHMAVDQGLAGIVMDGMQKMYESKAGVKLEPETQKQKMLKYRCFAEALAIEQDYEDNLKVIEKLAKYYGEHGIPMMLLKGYGLSLNYPVPSHRPTGDIDVYLWDKWQQADEAVTSELGIEVDNGHHHHSVFEFEGQMVENHYCFINVHSHRSNKDIEAIFKRMADDRSKAVEHTLPGGTRIWLPSPDLNVLFTARHCAIHFAAEQMFLRQLLDWALLVRENHTLVDWEQFWANAKRMGMLKFVLCLDEIAISKLGIPRECFHIPAEYASFAADESQLVARVLDDTLAQPVFDDPNSGTLKYLSARLRRWWRNRWKHRIVYSDSLFSTFFTQIRSHLMKPASLRGE